MYTAMAHRSTGYLVPATDYNQFCDNDAACAVSAFSAKGDLFVGSGSLAGARLAAGEDFRAPIYKSAETLGLFTKGVPVVLLSDVTEVVVSNTTTETDLWAVPSPGLPAGWLGTNGWVHMRWSHLLLNNSGASRNITWKIYYGGNTVSWTVLWGASATILNVIFDVYMRANAATNSQEVVGDYRWFSSAAPGGSGVSNFANTVIATDSTANQVLKLSITLATASAALYVKERLHEVQFHGPQTAA